MQVLRPGAAGFLGGRLEIRIGIGGSAKAPAVQQVAKLAPAADLVGSVQRIVVFRQKLLTPAARQDPEDLGRIPGIGLVNRLCGHTATIPPVYARGAGQR